MTASGAPRPADAAARPVAPARRLTTVDALRGFAILGILLVNATLFLHPVHQMVLGPDWSTPLDRAVEAAVTFVVEGKFFTLFSFLFGLGVALQARRAEARGEDVGPRARRRMAGLLAFGVAHVVLLWWGDILVYYALLGFVLVAFFRRAPARRLRRAAFVAAGVPVAFVLLSALSLLADGGGEADAFGGMRPTFESWAAQAERVYSGAAFGPMVVQRLQDWTFATVGTLTGGILFLVFAMFLLGAWAGRVGLFDDVGAHRGTWRRLRGLGVGLGLLGNGAYVALSGEPSAEGVGGAVGQLGYLLGAPALSLGYVAALTLWFAGGGGDRLRRALANVGRTALSNYLLQSLVMTTLAYGYGFGLYGRVGPAGAVGLALALYAIQVALSAWWTQRFRFGPLEWLWRWATYGRRPPWRREPSGA